MNLYEGIDGLRRVPTGAVTSIGNFDGLHLGHAKILQTMRQLREKSGNTAKLAVVTFEPHPLTVLRPRLAPPRLTPSPLKRTLLERAGVDELIVLPPTREVLGLSAEEFWAILREQARPSHLVEGASFNFGKNRAGTIDRLREWTTASNVQLHVIGAVEVVLPNLHVIEVSSTLVRWLISYGRARDAATCLGRPYALHGKVIRGHGRGCQIGTPTANLDCPDQLIPDDGVYAGRCEVAGTSYPVALSIGTMPTFGENRRQVEAHLIGFTGNLYDRVLQVEVIDWLREQWKFAGPQPLIDQLRRDLLQAERVLTSPPGNSRSQRSCRIPS
jgi:riboflavin kinase / FMN adenylyltransferase